MRRPAPFAGLVLGLLENVHFGAVFLASLQACQAACGFSRNPIGVGPDAGARPIERRSAQDKPWEAEMFKNMSNFDRSLRTFIAAPLAIAWAIVIGAGSFAGIVLFALAAIMVATSAIGFCPLYTLFHLETRKHTPVAH